MTTDERRSRRPALWGVAAGLALILLAPLVWWGLQPSAAGQQVTTVNAAAAEELASSNPAPPPPASTAEPAGPSASPGDSSSSPSSDVPSADPSPGAPAAPGPPPDPTAAPAPAAPAPVPEPLADPASLSLPTLGVEATVVPVGVTDDGEMQVPRDVGTVGWYRFGPQPGAPTGSAVITGHVDDVNQGPGAFARLGDLQPGDPLTVVDADGRTLSYTVLAREQWPKSQVPLDRLFDRSGEPRLVLITCGGAFDDNVLGYDDNIAITAVRTS